MQVATEYKVTIHHEDGSFWAQVLELPGCFASGESMEELWEALEEAIGLYLSSPGAPVTGKITTTAGIGEDAAEHSEQISVLVGA